MSALHQYISKLYSRTQKDELPELWGFMDETALIALGILLEETAKETLGKTGDLAFVEAARSDEENAFAKYEESRRERVEALQENAEKLRKDKLS